MSNYNGAKFVASTNTPDINSTDYWIDINENKYGGVIKYFDKDACEWKVIQFDLKIIDLLQAWFTCALSTLEKTLYKEIDTVNARIDTFEQKIKDVSDKVDALEDRVNLNIANLQQQVNDINAKLTDNYMAQWINNLIINNKIDVLDPVLKAMNKGTGVQLPLPSNNLKKISLPIWTGTASEYEAITNKVNGMTYNIIDE